MTVTVTPTPVTSNFTDFLYGFIKPEEAFIPRVYTDSVGVPTLGVGYALVTKQKQPDGSIQWALRPNLELEVGAIGVKLSTADIDVLREVALVLNANPPAPGQHVLVKGVSFALLLEQPCHDAHALN